ncbi:hypothetical protein [Streptomyces sp. AcH 505]|uniref:hypothetical protein n=1 Tax=Streptomyces sp. AcH 505 TaxID=352211 RepID=UPI0005A6A161
MSASSPRGFQGVHQNNLLVILDEVAAVPVFASKGGDRYHATRDCDAQRFGQAKWTFDPNSWVPGMPQVLLTSGHPLEQTTAQQAHGDGKTPCRSCRPAQVMVVPDDFDHRPVIGLTDGRGLGRTCRRCETRTVHTWIDQWGNPQRWTSRTPVRWPCTSAIVLELAHRSPEA